MFLYICLISIFVATAALPKDICETCVPTNQCPVFINLSKKEQLAWIEKFNCNNPGSVASGNENYVCCSHNVWGIESSERFTSPITNESKNKLIQVDNDSMSNGQGDFRLRTSHNPDAENNMQKSSDGRDYEWYPDRTQNYDNTDYWLNNQPTSSRNTGNFGVNRPYTNTQWNERPGRNQWGFRNINNNRGNENFDRNMNTFGHNTPRPRLPNLPNTNDWRTLGRNNNNNFRTNNPYPRPNPSFSNNGNIPGNSLSGQCDRLTSFPPSPESECCGREASDDDRITEAHRPYNFAPVNPHNDWHDETFRSANPTASYNDWLLASFNDNQGLVNADENDVTVHVENRISGGKATELYQYPWTVLLLTTFDYGNRQQGFNCGGSLLSAKYVLSAAHCVYDKAGVVQSVEVNLAEYDKRTFPRDCKTTQNGRNCIENIVMFAEHIDVHPQYDDQNLLNDISLIRLRGTAPYTDYIRPICLPTINIDRPMFTNLPFEVAGWGRNGKFMSDVKQSTVVRLVNQNDCRRYYRMLTDKHLCAAGHRGEDTCKGDSGGPLMILYRGKYYVAGVVSGKRADTPCGTANVPSLYTNVYHYLDWIKSHIRN